MSSGQHNITDAATKPLGEWQQSLVLHFTSIAKARKDKNIPVFALEHGLSVNQIKIIKSRLCDDFRQRGINNSLWLLWVVYCTEEGYNYQGEEYWDSFKENLRNWDNTHREKVRWAFQEFQRRFGGVIPNGKWAKQFSIIAWPITHAIVPQDLQYYFARLLFISRYNLQSISLNDERMVGKLLSKNSYDFSSSRFQNFLQQEDLVGRIALAMLNDNSENIQEGLIYMPTLRRIIDDLEQKRDAKQLFGQVRHELKPKLVGSSTTGSVSTKPITKNQPLGRKPAIIRPKIKLFATGETWFATIEIPRLSTAIQNSETVELLKRTRFLINGVKTNWLPTESILTASLKRRLSTWPSEKPLLTLEKINEELTTLIGEFKLTNAPWLFYINNDGTATEIQTKIVKPNGRYVLLFPDGYQIPPELKESCTIECENVFGRILNISSTPDDLEMDLLKTIGLDTSRSFRIWPAGLTSRFWDGTGNSEWLTTENPCFGFVHDYEVSGYTLKIGTHTLEMPGKTPGTPTFIKIDSLPPGRHILSIKPQSKAHPYESIEGLVLLDVREPESWTPGTTLHSGLSIQLDPHIEDLDSLLLGKTQLRIFGPPNHNVIVSLRFYIGKELVQTISSQPISFPYNKGDFKKLCSQALKDERLLLSRRMRLNVYCEGIGEKNIYFTRDLSPLRWLLKTDGKKVILRLIDEGDDVTPLEVSFYDLNRPESLIEIGADSILRGRQVSAVKGMFVASRGDYQASIIISQSDTSKGFAGLSIQPKMLSEPIDISEYIGFIKTWFNARCVDAIAQLHHQKVIELLAQRIFSTLCGSQWANHEMKFLSTTNDNVGLEEFSKNIGHRSIGDILRYRIQRLINQEINLPEQTEWFIGAIKRCQICLEDKQIRFAIKLSATCLSVEKRDFDGVQNEIGTILANKTLFRSCRFFILGISKQIDSDKNYSIIVPPGWQ